MRRYGMMLSTLNEEMLGTFRDMFYSRAGIAQDKGLVVHGLARIVSYGKCGWEFDQRLGGDFKMIFQRYCSKADRSEYGKYDHVIYIDIQPGKPRIADEDRQKAYEVKKDIASEVTREIEEYLLTNGLAIEIQV